MSKQTMFSGLEDAFGAEFVKSGEEHAKSYLLDMLLPDGTRFGDAMPVDLSPYADKTMEELFELLVDPDHDEVEFIKDPNGHKTTGDVNLVTEEELNERYKDIIQ
jgi:hypothetical protein